LAIISAKEGETVEVGALLGELGEASNSNAKPAPKSEAKKEEAPKAEATKTETKSDESANLSPAVRKMINDNGLDASAITGTGKDGRITKVDVQSHMETGVASQTKAETSKPSAPQAPSAPREVKDREERVKMTKLCKTIERGPNRGCNPDHFQ
jgi:2-oxoglutarate dehydrogenase E2 component (dihydrolipoamide succinyltransferase)